MDKWGYSETDIQEEYEVSRDKFMKSPSLEDIKHVIDDTAADMSQHKNKYIDNIINYDSCSINLI